MPAPAPVPRVRPLLLGRLPGNPLVPAAAAAFAAAALSVCVHRGWPVTVDEALHLSYGLAAVEKGSFHHVDESQMPVSALNALPVAGDPRPADPEAGADYWDRARAPTAALLAGLVAWWAARLYGSAAGWLAGAAAVVEPNLLAHGGLVTTDVPCATAAIAAAAAVAWAAARPGIGTALLAGGVLGVAQAAKYSSAYGVPLLVLGAAAGWAATPRGERPRLVSLVGAAGLAGVAAVATLAACYGFDGFPADPAGRAWRSELFKAWMPRLPAVPLPVPWDWLDGLDWVKQADEMGPGGIWVRGRMVQSGVPEYFAVAAAAKVPLGLLALPLVALAAPGWGWRASIRRESLLAVPLAGLVAQMSFGLNFQIGLRFLLPAFPFALVLLGRAAAAGPGSGARRSLALACVTLSALSVARFEERLIGYTNEAVPPLDAWRWVADSNLDWGQDRDLLAAYLADRQEPVNPKAVQVGRQVVQVNHLVGLAAPEARHRLLRECVPASARIGTSYLVFDVEPDALARCLPVSRGGGPVDPPPAARAPGLAPRPGGGWCGWLGPLDGRPHLLTVASATPGEVRLGGSAVPLSREGEVFQAIIAPPAGWQAFAVLPPPGLPGPMPFLWLDGPGLPFPASGLADPAPSDPCAPSQRDRGGTGVPL